MGKLHSQSLDELPTDGPNNWFFEHRADSLLQAAQKPQPHAVLQLEAGLDAYFARTGFAPVAIHDDLHPLNSLAYKNQVVLIDWNNLCRGDAAIDIGHLSAMLDWSMPDIKNVVAEHAPSAGLSARATSPGYLSLQQRTQAYTAFFRLRGFTFFDQ